MIAETIEGTPVLWVGKSSRRLPLVSGEKDEKGKPLTRLLSPERVSQLVDKGIWTQADLDTVGLVYAANQPTPDGQRIVQGTERLEDVGGQLTQVYDFEQVPPPPPVPPRTARQKWASLLAREGLTPEEVGELLK